jgi:hypothetical protein
MDINQLKVSGNLRAISDLLGQGGVGDPMEEANNVGDWEPDIIDIRKFVILFWGDLGMAERIMSLLEQRSIEATLWRRYQFMVFIMGLFHLKMACADTLWWIFIEPKISRDDMNSLMHFVALHRPR